MDERARLRPAAVHDLPAAYRVCLRTGMAGRDATAEHADPDLIGHVYAGPYLLFPDAVALVVVDPGGVAGYCLGVPDTVAFEQWCERVWWPPLRAAYPLRVPSDDLGGDLGDDPGGDLGGDPGKGPAPTAADVGLVRLLHAPPTTDPGLAGAYPAHLHVDLLPRLQGQGWGRRVVEALLQRLAIAGAPGVHLGVDEANTGAHGFYERLGFAEVLRGAGSRTYARSLVP